MARLLMIATLATAILHFAPIAIAQNQCTGEVCGQTCGEGGTNCSPISCLSATPGACTCFIRILDRPWGETRICIPGTPCEAGCDDQGDVDIPNKRPQTREEIEADLATVLPFPSSFRLTPEARRALNSEWELDQALAQLIHPTSSAGTLTLTPLPELWISRTMDDGHWTPALRASVDVWLETTGVLGIRVEFDDGRAWSGELWDGGEHGSIVPDDSRAPAYTW